MNKVLRLLLVEDSESDAALILRELRKQGYELNYTRVDNADAMVAALTSQNWDIVISDYILPHFSGLDALKLLQTRDMDIPCIITSGRIDDETAVAAMKSGAKDYIMKDNLKRLAPAVARELSESEVRRERKKTAEELRQNEIKLDILLDQMPCLLWTTDRDLKITSLAGAALRALHLNPGQLLGKSILEFMEIGDAKHSFKQAHQYALSGGSMSFEWQNGEIAYYSYTQPLFNLENKIGGAIGIAFDITSRKNAEASSRRLASIVESSNDAIISQTLDGIITSWNKGAEKIYGYSEDELLGQPVSNLTSPEFGNDMPLIMYKIRHNERVVNYETLRLKKDGKKINVSLTASPIKNDAGEVIGASIISRDISDRKIMERRILLSNTLMKLFWEVSSKTDYMEKAIEIIHKWSQCECAGIRVVDEVEKTIPYLAYRGFDSEFIKLESRLSLEKDQCACVRVILNVPDEQDTPVITSAGSFYLTHSAVFAKNLTEKQSARFRGVCIGNGFQTVVIVPIRHHQTVLGAIHIADRKTSALLIEDIETLESVADLIGQGIYRFDIEEKIRAGQNRLAEAQKIAHLGNWDWYIQTNKLYWSDEVFRIYGLNVQEIQPTYDMFLSYIHPDDRNMVQEAITAALSENRPYSLDHRIVLKDGSVRFVYEQANIIYDEGKPVHMVGIVQDVTNMKRIEEELRALSRRLVEVQENERRTIARELHDEIGQSLTALKMLLVQASRLHEKDNTATLDEAKNVVSELMQQVREMSLNLRPSMLDDLGLLPTLLWHFEKFTNQTGIQIKFDHSGLQSPLPPEVNTSAYRIVQEALTNIARYAGVDQAFISVRLYNDTLVIMIEDKGRGFKPSELNATKSAGLSGMKERVSLLNGRITLDTSPGHGTSILVELPIRRTEGKKAATS